MTHAVYRLQGAKPARAQSYTWIHVVGVAYCVLVGWFSVNAWLAAAKPFEAALCAGAQALAIVFAVLGRRAFNGHVKFSGALCIAISGGCAYWAAKGIGNAWAASGETAAPAMIWLLAALEPALFLLAENIEQANLRAADEAAKREAEDAAALAAARVRDAERDLRDHERRMAEIAATSHGKVTSLPRRASPARRAASTAAKIGAGGSIAMTGAAAAAEPGHVPSPVVEPAARHDVAHAGADARVARACAMRDQGLTRAEVAQALGVSNRTVSRLWAQARAETATALTGAAA